MTDVGEIEPDYTLYSALGSMYSGKARGYMNYKKLNYIDQPISILDMISIKRNTGEAVMPAVKTKDGEWLQDTTIIIEELEKRHPERSIGANTPIQFAVSHLLELWADEYWLPIAMHYRWSFGDENVEFLAKENGATLAPFLPKFAQRWMGRLATANLPKAAPIVGFIPEQHKMLENWTEHTLDLLETHFTHHDYLLGGRPTVADYGLLASFFGHLNRDPVQKRILMSKRPNLTAWVERTHGGDDASGDLMPDDALPETLMPILRCVFDEALPMLAAYRDRLNEHIAEQNLVSGDLIPRYLERAEFPMLDQRFGRPAWPFSLWKIQRVQNKIQALPEADQQKINGWLADNFGQKVSDFDAGPELIRHGLSTKLA